MSEQATEIIGRARNGRFVLERPRIGDTVLPAFNAALPRSGRVIVQCRRCFHAHHPEAVTMRQLRDWAYPGQSRKHWHQTNIYRALRRLGARRIGWGIYATCLNEK